jgi:hypothetical protein
MTLGVAFAWWWRGWRTRAGVALHAGSKLACLPSGVAAIVDAVEGSLKRVEETGYAI